jgi:phosphoribosyl-AMP cyclohydrolase
LPASRVCSTKRFPIRRQTKRPGPCDPGRHVTNITGPALRHRCSPPACTLAHPSSLPDAPRKPSIAAANPFDPLNLALCWHRCSGGQASLSPARLFVPETAPSSNRHLQECRILGRLCGYRATKAAREWDLKGVAVNDQAEREAGTRFMPKFDDKGLLCAVVVDHASRAVLMVAFMDAEALAATRATGLAHFHSRSRGKLWPRPRGRGNPRRLRPGRARPVLPPGGSDLSHGCAELLLPPTRGRCSPTRQDLTLT